MPRAKTSAPKTEKTYTFPEFLRRSFPNIADRLEAAFKLSSDDDSLALFKKQIQEAHRKKQE
jgi:hypothetical protein